MAAHLGTKGPGCDTKYTGEGGKITEAEIQLGAEHAEGGRLSLHPAG